MSNTPKALFFNGSPSKNRNASKMLKGAEEACAVCEMAHLYYINFKGCKSYQFNDNSHYDFNLFIGMCKRVNVLMC